jgi:hypothetical protein
MVCNGSNLRNGSENHQHHNPIGFIGSECSSAWLERVVWVHEVAGSNPVAPTIPRFPSRRGVRADKFLLHLKESEWRWNHRPDNLCALLLKETRSHPFTRERPSLKLKTKKSLE